MVLLLISLKANITEIKKTKLVIDDLVYLKQQILFFNIGSGNRDIKTYLDNLNYTNYQCLGKTSDYSKMFNILKTFTLSKIIAIGLQNKDTLTKYLDEYIGSNTDLFIVVNDYGSLSDSSMLINQGAYLLSSRYDLLR
ncbi:hypothetical protein LJB88_00135 [Erysipelotrichaceae bacterium OttesenSCG-928-M19]|nr:hypothetical protein [Erysipelotrichaceae bacterium OttesenSCG-928-M19]